MIMTEPKTAKQVNDPQCGALELAAQERQEIQPSGPLTIERAYNAVMSSSLSAEKLGIMKELLRMDAERQFADALSQLQAELPTIEATSVIPNRGKYARFEHIMAKIQPILSKHNFSVSFRQSVVDQRIVETCTLKHKAGFFTETPFAVRPGGKADSETQADCKASTTAKRNALCNALNIVIVQDCLLDGSDATIEGGCISPEDAMLIKKRLFATGADVLAFLKYAGVILPNNATGDEIDKAFSRIRSAFLPMLNESLKKKERTA